MPNLNALTNDLRGLPDQALQRELASPTGLIPSYLVLAEAQRRELTRQAAQRQQNQPSGTVYDEVLRNIMSRQPPSGPPPPAGMVPPPTGQGGAMPGATPPGNFAMARGGVVHYDDGGYTGQSADDDQDQAPPTPAVSPEGEADRTAAPDLPALFSATEQKYGLPPGLLAATARQESNLNPHPKVGSKGERGIMQFMPDTAKQYGLTDPDDPAQSIDAAGHYYSDLSKTFGGDVDKMIMAYNAGAGRVLNGDIPRTTLNVYHPRVVSFMQREEAERPQQNIIGPAGIPPPAQPAQTTPTPGAAPSTTQALAGTATGPSASPVPTEITQELARLNKEIGEQRTIMGSAAPNRFSPENIQSTMQSLYGISPDYLQGMNQIEALRSHAATIQQLQDQAIARMQQPANPGMFLINLAAGMSNSKNLSLPGAFSDGISYAMNARTQEQQNQLANVLALGKEQDAIGEHMEDLREKMGSAVGSLVERQSAADVSQQERALARLDTLEKNREELLLKMHPLKISGTDLNTAAMVQKIYQLHNLALPVNPDGTPRDPTTLRATDVPPPLQSEFMLRQRLDKEGWTPANINSVANDANAPADLRQAAQGAAAYAVTQAGKKAGEVTKATGEQKRTDLQANPQMTQAGENQMRELGAVSSQFDDLIQRLEPYKDDNNPMTLKGPMLKYKFGIDSPEGTLGNDISALSLGRLQAMMPFASKSRAQRYFSQIGEHLPNMWVDSPQLMYNKMLTVRRNLLRMEQSPLQWELKGGGPNPAMPVLDPRRFAAYTTVAGGDAAKAAQMAREDQWQVGPVVRDPNGNAQYFSNEAQAKAFEDAVGSGTSRLGE